MKRLVCIVLFALLVACGCQVSHNAKVMVNPQTGHTVVVSHHGTGKLSSALSARRAHESDVEALKKQGYQEANP